MSVYIAMPVYRGGEFIHETIRSILAQTYDDFHLVMSVDGADDPTIEECRKYENDPRIDVVVQKERLGWPGNFNWLVRNCDREFFCYWQQDDLASTGYLDALRRELLARDDAAIAYTDVQWFGARFDREGSPSVEGDSLSRVMQHVEAIRFEPLRGLIRASMMPSHQNPIPVTLDESCQEEFVFLAELAVAGAFLRVDRAMYFKRLHRGNVFARWAMFPTWRRRRGWISMGVGMYRVARRHSSEAQRPHVLGQILDRLGVQRHGRGHFYLPPQSDTELERFVRDFVSYASIPTDDLGESGLAADPLHRPVHPAIRRGLDREIDLAHRREAIGDDVASRGRSDLSVSDPDGQAVLGYGWSHGEPWGVWSDGGEATLRLPAKADGLWQLRLQGKTFPSTRQIRVRLTARPAHDVELISELGLLDVEVEVDPSVDGIVRLQLPDAVSPESEGVSADRRVLSVGLERIEFRPN